MNDFKQDKYYKLLKIVLYTIPYILKTRQTSLYK